MSDKLPEGYKEGIARVSNVVSFKYPFGGFAKQRYHQWLAKHDIYEPSYMKEAQDVGTFIHLQMENFIDGKPLNKLDELFGKHHREIELGIEYFSKLLLKYPDVEWHTEVVVKDEHERYQGSIDLVRVNEATKEVWLYDWKTWGIAKKKYGLPNELKKNTDKLKKVALQLSLYAETYRQKGYIVRGIYVVWLHEDECVEYSLSADAHRQKVPNIRIWTSEELNELLTEYLVREMRLPPDIILTINYKPMKISVQTPIPSIDYSKIEIVLEADDCNTGAKTPEQNIGEAIRLQKLALDAYTKK